MCCNYWVRPSEPEQKTQSNKIPDPPSFLSISDHLRQQSHGILSLAFCPLVTYWVPEGHHSSFLLCCQLGYAADRDVSFPTNSLPGILWRTSATLESGFFRVCLSVRRNSRPTSRSSRPVSIHYTKFLSAKVDENWEKRDSSSGSLCRPECHSSSGRISRLCERNRSYLLVHSIRDIYHEPVLCEDHGDSVGRLLAGTEREGQCQSVHQWSLVQYPILHVHNSVQRCLHDRDDTGVFERFGILHLPVCHPQQQRGPADQLYWDLYSVAIPSTT